MQTLNPDQYCHYIREQDLQTKYSLQFQDFQNSLNSHQRQF